MSRTFSIIKPDATNRNLTGGINKMIEEAGLRIVAQRRIHMSDMQAKKFYEVHARASLLWRAGGVHDLCPRRCPSLRSR